MPSVRPDDIANMRPHDLLGALSLFDALYSAAD